MMKYLLILSSLSIIALIALFFYKKQKLQGQEIEKPLNTISTFSADDTELKRFKDTAQAQIGYLIEFMNEHDREDTLFRYFIKSPFSEKDITEHMWTQVYEFKDGFFIGTLANDPTDIKQLKYNDAVKVAKEDVEDWRLQDFLTNTQVGGFSTDYLHKGAE